MAEQNLKALKTLVISMGVILVVGFFIVMAAAWAKMKAATVPSGAKTEVGVPADCKGGEIDVSGRGRLSDTSVQGSQLRMVFNRAGEFEIMHVDLCSGQQVGSLKVRTEPKPKPSTEGTF